ncbi:MAG: hypothetical protein WC503_01060 [Candidatus Shapirobacteria bacterium]
MRKLLKKAEDLIKAANTPDVEAWQNTLIDFEKEVKRIKNSRSFLLKIMKHGYVRTLVDNDIIIFYKRDERVSESPDEVTFEALKILGFKPEAA